MTANGKIFCRLNACFSLNIWDSPFALYLIKLLYTRNNHFQLYMRFNCDCSLQLYVYHEIFFLYICVWFCLFSFYLVTQSLSDGTKHNASFPVCSSHGGVFWKSAVIVKTNWIRLAQKKRKKKERKTFQLKWYNLK